MGAAKWQASKRQHVQEFFKSLGGRKKSIKSFHSLIQAVDYAEIHKELFFYLSQNTDREILRKTIIDKYFLNIEPMGISNAYYLDIIAEQILNDSAAQYKKKIQQLQKNEHDENFKCIFRRYPFTHSGDIRSLFVRYFCDRW